MASFESSLGVRGTYYFRTVPSAYNEEIICQIAKLRNEVGYHYEDMNRYTVRGVRHAEVDLAKISIESFALNLKKLRKIVPVSTICMHGSPMSRWDSRLLWKYYDYHDFGIVGEPYFDVDFDKALYLTDTGRRWDGASVNIRDKASGVRCQVSGRTEGRGVILNKYSDWRVNPIPGSLMNMTQKSIDFQNKYKFKSTFDIIEVAERGELSNKIMITFHPQRWTDRPIPWVRELVWQNVKNAGKYFLVKIR